MHGAGPAPGSDEVEHAARIAVEVVVLWSGDVLGVSHFAAPGAVFVGNAGDCDVALPAELLGAERRCVAVSSRADVCVVLPAGAQGWLSLPGGSTRPLGEPMAALGGEPSDAAERLLPLALGYRAHLCFANLEIQVATVRLGRRSRRTLGVDASVLVSLGLSAFTVASAMAVLSRLTPALGLAHDEQAQNAQLRLLRTYLAAAAERAVESRAEEPSRAAAAAPLPRHTSTRGHQGGSFAPDGAPAADIEAEPAATAEPTLGLGATPQPARDPIERRRQLQEARSFGIIGMLDWPELKDPKLKFERHMSGEELALMQELFNPEFSPMADGPGGLALSGTGIGGGGKADAIALGAVRTVGEGEGAGLDQLPGAVLAARTLAAPPLRQHESIVSDPLAAASIRRAVHAQHARLRGCYADAPGSEPALAMGTMVRFVVQGNGRFEQVRAAEPSLPAGVSHCIERVFLGLSVPNPVSRPVQVAYRIALGS
jgi:hypothetical protein